MKIRSKPLGDVIKHKHRFVVMDTDTFKEKFSFQLSGINIFVTVGITVIVLIVLTTVLIAFTPLREYIPGYTNTEMVEQTYANAKKIDSLETAVANQEWLIATMQALVRGDNPGGQFDSVRSDSTATLEHVAAAYRRSIDDSLLRLDVEHEDSRYEVKNQPEPSSAAGNSVLSHLLFAPVKGAILRPYNASERHYGVDIAGTATTPVNAAYSGTVVFAGFAAEDGHVIAIQHPGGLITIYRNNSTLLKHQGDAVRAGEPIAYLGGGSQTDAGPHLHLEVWVGGTPVNPEEYIPF